MKKKGLLIVLMLSLLSGCFSSNLPPSIAENFNGNYNENYTLCEELFTKIKYKEFIDRKNNLCFDLDISGYTGLKYFQAKVEVNVEVDVLLPSGGSYLTKQKKFILNIDQQGYLSLDDIVICEEVMSYIHFEISYTFSGYAMVLGNI